VRNHLEALHTSSFLTSHFRRMHQPKAAKITPEKVIKILHAAGIKCVLMGTHALDTYRDQARATQDVDILVHKMEMPRTIRAIQDNYPKLTLRNTRRMTHFLDPSDGKGVIDVMRPNQALYKLVSRHSIAIGDTHRVPDLEMTLASKFVAMCAPNRAMDKQFLDAGDFINVVQHHRAGLDVSKLKYLAGRINQGYDTKVAKIIKDIDAGRMIQL